MVEGGVWVGGGAHMGDGGVGVGGGGAHMGEGGGGGGHMPPAEAGRGQGGSPG